MPMDLFRQLWRWWEDEPLSDELKGQDPFRYMLCETDDVPWYLVDDTVFVVYKLRPGWDAEMLTLNLHKVDRSLGYQELHNIFSEYDLQRITLPVPHPIRKTARAAHRLGFTMEGRLRDATFYEGIFQDLDLFGAHRSGYEDSGPVSETIRSGRKRRRRKKEAVEGVKADETAPEIDAT